MSFNVGDQVRASYNLKDYAGADFSPGGSGRVVFRLWAPGDAEDEPSVAKTWLAAGGGDAELVNDSTGDWHILYTTLVAGKHRCEFQAYSNTVDPDNSIERTLGAFIAK
jgi:hypothetical protein